MLAEQTPAQPGGLRPDRPRRRVAARHAVLHATRAAGEGAGRARRRPCTSRGTPSTRPRRRSGSTSSRERGSTASWPSGSTAPYKPNGRTMLKVKHSRTADVVVAGYRLHKTSTPERPLLGSMLLGLYADDGRLQHVGVCASFSEARRAELYEELDPLRVEFADHPWGAWQDEAAQAQRPSARWPEPLDRHQGPLLRAAAPEARRRGRLRAHGGRPIPAHRPVQALARRPRARVLRLRPARRGRRLRPRPTSCT